MAVKATNRTTSDVEQQKLQSINSFIAKHFTSKIFEQNNNSNEILQRSQEEAELMMGTGSPIN